MVGSRRPRVALLLLWALVAVACRKGDARFDDPELDRLVERPLHFEEVHGDPCTGAPFPSEGVLLFDEGQGEQIARLALRLERAESGKGGGVIWTVRSARIRTEPAHVPWSARIEEEMVGWPIRVSAPGGTGDLPSSMLLVPTELEMRRFHHAVVDAVAVLELIGRHCRARAASRPPVVAVTAAAPDRERPSTVKIRRRAEGVEVLGPMPMGLGRLDGDLVGLSIRPHEGGGAPAPLRRHLRYMARPHGPSAHARSRRP